MNCYRIAVIVAGIDEPYQRRIIRGLQASAAECELEFCIFASFSGVMGNASHDAGELNIFNLPDFRDFDGAILMTNTINSTSAVNNILQRITYAGIPAVNIDNDVKTMLHIGIDNKTAMRDMTKHFITKHGFTRFSYISGPADNPESVDRINGFKEVLAEHGLSIDENHLFYGDFRAPSGKAAIDKFLSDNQELPQAIICANDVMAAAAVNRLSEKGFNVPEQIAVSGFDNTYRHHDLRIDLTTVERPLLRSGKFACEMLYNYFHDIPQDRSRLLNSSLHFTESCGCGDPSDQKDIDFKSLNTANFYRLENVNRNLALFNKLSRDLHSCSTFDEYIDVLKSFIKFIDPEEFYFCVCNDWAEEFVDDKGSFRKDEFISTEYTSTVHASIVYSNGKFYEECDIPLRSLMPDVAAKEAAGKCYYFLPLHFGERCLGYMVILNCPTSLHHTLIQSWSNAINNSLENIRKLICLDFAVKKLGNLYARDSFTGIFNRNGFVLATTEIFRKCADEKRKTMLMFIDLDGLKVINDTLGHDVGDFAIRSIANVLEKSCTNGEIFCRFGGDEFIVFAADCDENDAELLTKRIQDNISAVNRENDNSFVLSASTGYIIAVPKKYDDLFRFVTDADKVMYEQKRKKKRSNYLKK